MTGATRLPSGTATFLLADVEGSTSAWEADPSGTAAAIDGFRALVGEIVAAHGGLQPLEQGEGDSCVVVFARASEAVAAAVALQLGMAASGALRVRVGLHSGDAVVRAEGTVTGSVLNRAARVRDLGHGGQVLISDVTHQLVVDDAAGGMEFLALGTHELRGLSRPERVWQLCHPELPRTFPPLRSTRASAGAVPIPATSFVGRVSELADVAELLATSRLVTLTGTGGCGKTRMAIELARATAQRFTDGVVFADLAPVASAERVAPTVAEAAGVVGDDDPVRSLVAALTGTESMLVLDNCEHVIAAASAVVAEILRCCPSVIVVVTSREPLGVEGEHTWRVPSLGIPAAAVETIEELYDFDAVRLFAERARQARPTFELSTANVAVVTEICVRLDGIPLAIELVAARLRFLSPERVAAGLDDRFRLLGGGTSGVSRQRTLEGSVAWSHDLLDEFDRVALRRLSVFAGGFTLDAAETVIGIDPIEPEQILERIGRLVDRSLVVFDEATGRYGLQETIRQFASDRLIDADEASTLRDRHASFFEQLFHDDSAGVTSGDESSLIRAVQEQHNLRAAISWVIAGGNAERAVRILLAARGVYMAWALIHEGRLWTTRVLALPGAAAVPGELRAPLLAAHATTVLFDDGDVAAARRIAEEALALARADAPDLVSSVLVILTQVAIQEGAWNEARRWASEAVATGNADLGTRVPASALAILSGLAIVDSDFVSGSALAHQALDAAQAAGDAFEVGQAAGFIALHAVCRGDLAEAAAAIVPCRRQGEVLSNPWLEGVADTVDAYIAARTGRYLDGQQAAARAKQTFDRTGTSLHQPMAHVAAAEVAYAAGDLECARQEASIAIDSGRGALGTTLTAFVGWFVVAFLRPTVAQGDAAAARAVIAEMREQVPDPYHQALIQRHEGLIAAAEGDPAAAYDLAQSALATLAAVGAHGDVADTLDDIAILAVADGHALDGLRLAAAADAFRVRTGAVLPQPDRARLQVGLNAARAAAGDDAFEAAWAEGAGLSIDQAVVYASRRRGQRLRPTSGWSSLTPAERSVVDLVATGATTEQIAERLFVTRNTVKTHLAHIYTKLDIRTRSELAAVAARRAANADHLSG